MFTGVKLPGRSLAATSDAGQTPLGRLFYITDQSSGTRFLVDTGSEVSVILPRAGDRKCTMDSLTLQAVNNTPIPTYGTRSLTLNLGLRRTFQWVFVIADVQRPIIGADFLRHFGLLVDMKQHQITDGTTHLRVQGIVTQDQSPSPAVVSKDYNNPFLNLLSKYPTVTQVCSPDQPIKHDVTHHITTAGPPVSAQPRRLSPDRLRITRQKFDHMLQLGIIQPSSSDWASPLHMVPKKSPGDWRPCGDHGRSKGSGWSGFGRTNFHIDFN